MIIDYNKIQVWQIVIPQGLKIWYKMRYRVKRLCFHLKSKLFGTFSNNTFKIQPELYYAFFLRCRVLHTMLYVSTKHALTVIPVIVILSNCSMNKCSQLWFHARYIMYQKMLRVNKFYRYYHKGAPRRGPRGPIEPLGLNQKVLLGVLIS